MAKILVIDDEKDVRVTVREILRRAGFEVITAANGKDGLGLMRDEGADLVITDVIMPGMDGVAVARELRRLYAGVRIIVISGGGNVYPMQYEPGAISTNAYLASAVEAGADLALTKPFQRQELIDAVESLLEPASNA